MPLMKKEHLASKPLHQEELSLVFGDLQKSRRIVLEKPDLRSR